MMALSYFYNRYLYCLWPREIFIIGKTVEKDLFTCNRCSQLAIKFIMYHYDTK